MLVQRWSDVVYSGPTLIQHRFCVCWDMTEIQIMEQYNCITYMYKDHYSGNVCSVYFKQGKDSE